MRIPKNLFTVVLFVCLFGSWSEGSANVALINSCAESFPQLSTELTSFLESTPCGNSSAASEGR